ERSEAVGALLHAGLINAVWTVVLALAAALGSRWWRRHPAVGHGLWLLVLLKLVTPSLVQFTLPFADVPTRDVAVPVASIDSRGPAPAARPSVDLGRAVSESGAAHDEHPPQVSHPGSVTRSSEPSRPLVPRPRTPWELTRQLAVPGVALLWLVGAV